MQINLKWAEHVFLLRLYMRYSRFRTKHLFKGSRKSLFRSLLVPEKAETTQKYLRITQKCWPRKYVRVMCFVSFNFLEIFNQWNVWGTHISSLTLLILVWESYIRYSLDKSAPTCVKTVCFYCTDKVPLQPTWLPQRYPSAEWKFVIFCAVIWCAAFNQSQLHDSAPGNRIRRVLLTLGLTLLPDNFSAGPPTKTETGFFNRTHYFNVSLCLTYPMGKVLRRNLNWYINNMDVTW